MLLARVTGTLVATQKNRKLEGAKLLLVQPLTLEDTPRGPELLAVDGVGAGVQEKVLIVLEGRSASDAIGRKAAPVDAAIVGIVDRVESGHMNEGEVRALVREAIERHLGRPASAAQAAPYSHPIEIGPVGRARLQSSGEHSSHVLLKVLPGSDMDDGMCVIEPAVRCNHCGFCQSYGH